MKHVLAITFLFLIHALFLGSVIAKDNTQWKLPEGAKARLSKGKINGISFSPDGTQIAVGSATGIWLYDARTGVELALLTDHTSQAGPVAFSPDGKTLVSGVYDKIFLWDVTTRKLLKSFKKREARIKALRILEDGKTLICEDYDRLIQLWDVTTGRKKENFHPFSSRGFGGFLRSFLRSVLRSVTGNDIITANLYLNPLNNNVIFAIGYKDGTIRLEDGATRRHLKTLQGHKHLVYQLVFSPDGTLLASNTVSGPIRLWDITTGHSLKALTQDTKIAGILMFSTDSKTLACQTKSGEIELWDVETKMLRTTLGEMLDSPIHTLTFSPDTKTVAGVNQKGEIRVWDAYTGNELSVFIIGHTPSLNTLAFSPDSGTLASGHSRTILLWDASSMGIQSSKRIDTNTWLSGLAFSPDGNTVSSIKHFSFKKQTRGNLLKESVLGTLSLWDTHTGNQLSVFPIESHTGEAPKIPRQKGTMSSFHGMPDAAVFSQNGSMLAIAADSKRVPEYYQFAILLWDIPDRQLHFTLKGHTDTIDTLAFTTDGRTLASGSEDGTIRLWDTSVGSHLLSLPAGKPGALAFSMDGKILASINSAFSIQLWDVATGSKLTAIKGQNDYGNVLAFSADSKILACGSGDGTIRLWDVATGNKLSTLKGHVDWVQALVFSSDGKTLASGSSDGAIFLWNVPN